MPAIDQLARCWIDYTKAISGLSAGARFSSTPGAIRGEPLNVTKRFHRRA
jgi:hypothetical protein